MADDTYVQAVRYEADITDVQGKLDRLADQQDETETKTKTATGRMSKSWDNVSGSVKKIAGGLALLGGAALIAAPKILNAGASLEGLDAKASTVFEGSLDAVNNWASQTAGAMGLTQSQARDAAAAMADLLKPMGFNAAQAADMSTSMIDLSGALSAWTGGTRTAAEVSAILSKAMLGERDGLKELGISISEADVQARLAKNGTQDLTGAALEQAKALATQQLILEKSTDAQTAWADGSMDAAKEQNKMKAATAQLGESFNRALYPALKGILPVVTTVADWLGKNMPGAIETLKTAIGNVSDWFSEHKTVMIATAVALGAVLVGLFTAWAVGATSAAVATLAAAAPFIAVGAAIGALVGLVIWAYQEWEGFRNVVNTVKDFIVNDLVPAFQDIWAFISDKLIPIVQAVAEVYFKALVAYFNVVRSAIVDYLVPAFQDIWAFISDKLIPIVQTVAEVYFKALVAYFGVVRSAIMDYLLPAFVSIGTTIYDAGVRVGEVVGNIVDFVTGLPGRIFGTIYSLWDGLRNGTTEAKDWVKARIDEVVGFATGLPGRMAGVFSGMWDGIKNSFASVINAVIRAWNSLSFEVPRVEVFGRGVGGNTIGVPQIDPIRLAAGGLAFGPTLAIVGDNPGARTDPEVIAPLSKLAAMIRAELSRPEVADVMPREAVFIIEGHPFRAILAERETELRRVS